MTAARIALVSAIAAVVAWALKGVAIGAAGGLDKSAFESPLFAIGMVALVVAVAAFGVAVTAGRPAWQRALAGIAAVVIGVVGTILIQTVIDALLPDSAGWVQEEAGLWASSLLAAVLIFLWLRRRQRMPSGAVA